MLKTFSPIAALLGMFAAIFISIIPGSTTAQVYSGPGLGGGINRAGEVLNLSPDRSSAAVQGTILNFLGAVLQFMALAAVVVIVIAGIYMVVSVGDDSAKEKAKKIIGYAIGGLIIIALSSAIVFVVATSMGIPTGGGGLFGVLPLVGTGNIYVTIVNIVIAVLGFMALAAVVVIVIAGIYMVVSVGDDSAKEKAKKIIGYAVAGLVIIAIASGIVLVVIGPLGGSGLFGDVPIFGSGNLRLTILNLLKTVLNFMGLIAVVVIVIAGILLVVSGGEEQTKDRAKRIIWYAIIGLLVILFASAIVSFIANSIT